MLKQFRAKGQIIRNSHTGFLLLWTGATAIGYAVGGLISGEVARTVGGGWGLFLSFAVISAVLGLMQWLVFSTKIRGIGWFWATCLGGTLGGSFSSWASFQIAITYGDAVDLLVIYGCLRGLTTGIAQWLILRRCHNFADWWIVASTVSWYVSILIGSLLMDKLGHFLILLVGTIYGVLTGSALLLILGHRRQ